MTVSNRVALGATLCAVLLSSLGGTTPSFAQDADASKTVLILAQVPAFSPAIETATLLDDQSAIAPAMTVEQAQNSPSVDGPSRDGDSAEPRAYASLSEAVAANQAGDARDDNLICMAGAIYFEAKGEPLSGQLAVANVILNRTKSGRFPRSVCSVVKQPGQFSFVRGGQIPAIAANNAYRTAIAVARVAIADAWRSPAPDAMYFHARRATPNWGRIQVAAIGNHLFYR